MREGRGWGGETEVWEEERHGKGERKGLRKS